MLKNNLKGSKKQKSVSEGQTTFQHKINKTKSINAVVETEKYE